MDNTVIKDSTSLETSKIIQVGKLVKNIKFTINLIVGNISTNSLLRFVVRWNFQDSGDARGRSIEP